jgi:hypothetical protein
MKPRCLLLGHAWSSVRAIDLQKELITVSGAKHRIRWLQVHYACIHCGKECARDYTPEIIQEAE